MKISSLIKLLFLCLCSTLTFANSCPEITSDYYLFTYFKGNGEDGIHLAFSFDAQHFYAFNNDKSIFMPTASIGEGIIRDPVAVQGVDGTYHVVWSAGWNSTVIGYASTNDFIHWNYQDNNQLQKAISPYPRATENFGVWAPALFFDKVQNQFIILWSYFKRGKPQVMFYNTTKDFKSISDAQPYFTPNYAVIDGALALTEINGKPKYILMYKDERDTELHIDVARLPQLYPAPNEFFTAKTPDIELQGIGRALSFDEGPSILQVTLQDGNKASLVYYDHYFGNNGPLQHYGAYLTKDFNHFEKINSCLRFPNHPRHGAVIKTSCKVIADLWDRFPPEVVAGMPGKPICK